MYGPGGLQEDEINWTLDISDPIDESGADANYGINSQRGIRIGFGGGEVHAAVPKAHRAVGITAVSRTGSMTDVDMGFWTGGDGSGDGDGNKKPYGDRTPTTTRNNISDIICIGFTPNDGSCPEENTLVSVIASTSRNNLNNSINPTAGNKFSFGTEQFFSMGKYSHPKHHRGISPLP